MQKIHRQMYNMTNKKIGQNNVKWTEEATLKY